MTPQEIRAQIKEMKGETPTNRRGTAPVAQETSPQPVPQDIKSVRDIRVTPAVEAQKTEKLKKEQFNTPRIDRRHSNGGHHNGGRKTMEKTLIARGIKQWIDEHVNEEVEVQITDRKTGKTKIVKIPRTKVVLQQLYLLGMGQTDKGNPSALQAWLDRAVGKAVQPIEHKGDKDAPLHLILE